jgi:hypothetical protein
MGLLLRLEGIGLRKKKSRRSGASRANFEEPRRIGIAT